MTLKTACEIALECGLNTVEEAVRNVDIHCMQLLPYNEIDSELYKLHKEYKAVTGYAAEMLIKDYLSKIVGK